MSVDSVGLSVDSVGLCDSVGLSVDSVGLCDSVGLSVDSDSDVPDSSSFAYTYVTVVFASRVPLAFAGVVFNLYPSIVAG